MEVDDSATSGESSRPKMSMPSTREKEEASTPSTDKILYGVEECPPWYLCAFLALQVSSFKSVINSVYFTPTRTVYQRVKMLCCRLNYCRPVCEKCL